MERLNIVKIEILPKVDILRNCQDVLWYVSYPKIKLKLPVYEFEIDIFWVLIYRESSIYAFIICHSEKYIESDGGTFYS